MILTTLVGNLSAESETTVNDLQCNWLGKYQRKQFILVYIVLLPVAVSWISWKLRSYADWCQWYHPFGRMFFFLYVSYGI